MATNGWLSTYHPVSLPSYAANAPSSELTLTTQAGIRPLRGPIPTYGSRSAAISLRSALVFSRIFRKHWSHMRLSVEYPLPSLGIAMQSPPAAIAA